MTWRIEASGGAGSANCVIIQPVPDDDPHSEIRHALITVSPKGGRDHPTLPLLPEGALYRDRLGITYRVKRCSMIEIGTDDGEHSIWCHQYLATYSATLPVGSTS